MFRFPGGLCFQCRCTSCYNLFEIVQSLWSVHRQSQIYCKVGFITGRICDCSNVYYSKSCLPSSFLLTGEYPQIVIIYLIIYLLTYSDFILCSVPRKSIQKKILVLDAEMETDLRPLKPHVLICLLCGV